MVVYIVYGLIIIYLDLENGLYMFYILYTGEKYINGISVLQRVICFILVDK